MAESLDTSNPLSSHTRTTSIDMRKICSKESFTGKNRFRYKRFITQRIPKYFNDLLNLLLFLTILTEYIKSNISIHFKYQ